MTAEQIQPVLAALDTICAETAAPPTALVVFGASGDLVSRKLLPSLAQIQQHDLLSENFCLLGCGRTDYSDEQSRRTPMAACPTTRSGPSSRRPTTCAATTRTRICTTP
jgi:glucose-6-phosphate 1-dehydrogenase